MSAPAGSRDAAPDSGFDSVHAREAGAWTVRDPDAHGRLVRSMFARISGVYDSMNHLLSLNRDRAWRRRLVEMIDGDTWEVLDLCAGTGDLALAGIEAGKGRFHVGADFCPEMLQGSAGKRGADQLHGAAADALRLPFRDNSFDAVTVGFGVRNFADVRRGLSEIARVLRPGGQLLVLEFFRDDPEAEGDERGVARPVRAAMSATVRVLGRLVGRDGGAYSYLPSSMDQFLTPRELRSVMGEFGFGDATVTRLTFGIAHIVTGRLP